MAALHAMVDRDVQELRVPLLIVASNGAPCFHTADRVGVGETRQVDDLAALAAVAAASGIWLHADGYANIFFISRCIYIRVPSFMYC
jgi:glutamate/tyrosine decarboxylase-like PLP-dependent enzyme